MIFGGVRFWSVFMFVVSKFVLLICVYLFLLFGYVYCVWLFLLLFGLLLKIIDVDLVVGV